MFKRFTAIPITESCNVKICKMSFLFLLLFLFHNELFLRCKDEARMCHIKAQFNFFNL